MVQNCDGECVKKSTTYSIIYPEPTGEKQQPSPHFRSCPTTHKPSVCRIKPKIIRVCSRTDMKKMIPPKICECPKPSGGRGSFGLLLFGIKAAIAAAAVYVSYDLGVWGTIDETQEMYRTFCAARKGPLQRKNDKWSPPSCEAERSLHRSGYFNQFSHCDVPPIDLEQDSSKLGKYWNCGIESAFKALAGLPFNVIDKIRGININTEKQEEIVCDPNNTERIENKYK